MSLASDIEKLNQLKRRASKQKLKISFVYADPIGSNRCDWFGIGSARIKDLQAHIDRYEGDYCKVAVFRTLNELEAFILSREMIN